MTQAWVGLGANLSDPVRTIKRALRWLETTPGVLLEQTSGLYRTQAVGPAQPCYINAVARLHTTLAPVPFLRMLHAMESAAGRVRLTRWGPRTLDLDVLFFGSRILDLPMLTVPHPRAHERRFVLEPLASIDADLVHPRLGMTVSGLLERLSTGGSGDFEVNLLEDPPIG